MNVFKFVTPSGQTIEITGPAGSTYDQAQAIFNQQYATGSLSGLRAGDVLNSLVQAKGGLVTALSQVISAANTGNLATIAGALTKIPNLPAENPTSISTFVNTPVLAGSPVGPLSTTQIQGLLSSTAAAVNQNPTDISNEKGLGRYGLSADQLQQAGLIKPGTAELVNQDPASLVSTLSSPTVWTGLGGADSLDSVLANPSLQSVAQQSTLASSYSNLSELGVINDNKSSLADPYAGLTTEQLQSLGNADPTDPIIRYRLGLPALADTASTVGPLVNNAANFGLGPTLGWLNNTLGGSDIGQLTTSTINSIFGQTFGSVNQAVSGGGNPLQTGVQSPKGYSHTVNRSVIDTAFNNIIGNDKVPANIFANPVLGIDIRAQATQLSTVNQSASILLTRLASTAAGVAALSQVPGANPIIGLLQSGQGLLTEVKGAAQLLDTAKNLPGVGELLKDVPGSKEVLAELQTYGKELLDTGLDALGLDSSALSDFDTSTLISGAEDVIEAGKEYAAEAIDYIASFW
jgi:hypothetical protein